MNIFLKSVVKKPVVIGMGLITLDLVLDPQADVPPQIYTGGTCGNILAILGYLGWKSYPVSRLNDDVAAQKVIQDLEKWHVNTEFIKLKPAANTPIIVQEIKKTSRGESYHKFSWICPQCGAWLPSFRAVTTKTINEIIDEFPKPQVFFFDRVSRSAITLAEKFASEGAIIFFEPSGVSDIKLFKEALQISHIIKYAEDRASSFKELISSFNPMIEIETLGKKGLRFRTSLTYVKQQVWTEIAAFKANVVDSAGAGDWCSAGIIHSLGRFGIEGLSNLSESSFTDALITGQAMASWTCGFTGSRAAMYQATENELNNFIKQTLSNNELTTIEIKNSIKLNFMNEYSCPACINSVKTTSTTVKI
jgi:sugar/nucleoside kinase (ribokinase family)